MDLRLDVENAVQITAAFAQAPEIVMEELETVMGEAVLRLQREVSELSEATPRDSGKLAGSFITDVEAMPVADMVVGTVSTPLPYALPVELGTKPYYPPIEPILDWVTRNIGKFQPRDGKEPDPLSIAHAIKNIRGRQGKIGRYMLTRSFASTSDEIMDMFAEASARIKARIEAKGNASKTGGQA